MYVADNEASDFRIVSRLDHLFCELTWQISLLLYPNPSLPSPLANTKNQTHTSSVNNLVIQQLIERSSHYSLSKFLEKELSSVSSSIAKRIVTECGWDDDRLEPQDLTSNQITKLVQVLRTVQLFQAPDGSCLSPLGEYNLNLGIRKVLEPEYIATARDKPCAYEGHPFIVEAAISLGGKDTKEGISVFRFANRIPLLFEAGADVSTRVANTKIKWSTYKIDHKRDRIGVFVSIVSTKIPYKGTGKEYIGDDITEISTSVKRALQSCCQQLRTHLQKRNALRDQRERKSKLTKYIPDVTRSLMELLQSMKRRHLLEARSSSASGGDDDDYEDDGSPRKKRKVDQIQQTNIKAMISRLDNDEVTEDLIRERLEDAVNIQNDLEEETHKAKDKHNDGAIPLYIKPLFNMDDNSVPGSGAEHDIDHPLFTFRPIHPISP